MIRNTSILLLSVAALSTSACTGLGLATGAAAVTGISVAQEGGLNRAFTDTKIKIRINDAWLNYDVEAFAKLSTTINQGRVLITGVVQKPEQRVEAVRLAWQVDGVKQVINEIQVAKSAGITGFVKDKWITSRLRGALTFDRNVQSINYSIDTVQGVIYLMGVAQNQAELNLVIEKARTISGVKQVVSYVKLAGEPLRDSKILSEGDDVDLNNTTRDPLQIHSTTTNSTTSTNTNLKTRNDYMITKESSNVINNDAVKAVETDVPTRIVPENAPSIEDQYN